MLVYMSIPQWRPCPEGFIHFGDEGAAAKKGHVRSCKNAGRSAGEMGQNVDSEKNLRNFYDLALIGENKKELLYNTPRSYRKVRPRRKFYAAKRRAITKVGPTNP